MPRRATSDLHPDERAWWRNYQLLRSYNISLTDYYLLLDEQHGGCALCGKAPDEGQVLCVDHCAKTGEVRGLLCDRCNRAIGLYEDAERLRAAADYLDAPPARAVKLGLFNDVRHGRRTVSV